MPVSFPHHPIVNAMQTTNTKQKSKSTRDHSGEISLLAYHLWQESGCPAGQDVHFWLQAERQLLGASSAQAAAKNGGPRRVASPLLAASRAPKRAEAAPAPAPAPARATSRNRPA